MNGAISGCIPVEVRRGQVWEFSIQGHLRRARVLRVTVPIYGVRYVFLKRITDGRLMRMQLRRLQRGQFGARLVEGAPTESFETKSRPTAEVVERRLPGTTVHEPRMSISDRRHAVARAYALRGRGMTVAHIAKALCVMPEVVEFWLSEEPPA